MKRIAGPLITTMILVGIGAILLMNLDLTPPSNRYGKAVDPVVDQVKTSPLAPSPKARPKGNSREYPIGDTNKNSMWLAAVWLPSVGMDGNAMAGSDIIHIEADVKASEGNPHGFAKGEFIPYLKISYEIKPAKGGEAIQKGELLPMVATDGPHYGASVVMPKAGEYQLTYNFQPPSAGGLGRHSDPITGVAPWWEPFSVTFDWDFEGLPTK